MAISRKISVENQVLLVYGNDRIFTVSSNVRKAVDVACPIEQQASSIEKIVKWQCGKNRRSIRGISSSYRWI